MFFHANLFGCCYSVLRGYFPSHCGLRQGNPLSSFLFVVGMEYLSRLLKNLVRLKQFQFHPKCKPLEITHLCFADDVMIFTKGNERAVSVVQGILHSFSAVSGLSVSVNKSAVFLCGVEAVKGQRIRQILGMPLGELPIRYLGIPLHARSLRSHEYQGLVEKVRGKMRGWYARHLSYAGRLCLINSILYSILRFWCSILFLPLSVVEKIQGVCRDY